MTALAPLDITVGGISLNTYAHFVTTRNGWDSTPGLIGSNLRVPGKDGEVSVTKDYGPGRMVLQITVTGTDADGAVPAGMTEATQFRSNMDNLLRLFGFRGLQRVVRWMEDDSTRENYAEVGAVIAPDYIDGATTANLTVELIFPDPFWQGDLVSIEPAGSSTNGRQLNLTGFAGSTAPINDAVFVFTGPATNPFITDIGTGAQILYNGTLAAGTNWRVDCANFKSEVGPNLGFNINSGVFSGTATSVLASTQFSPGPRFFVFTPYVQGIGDSNTTPGAPAIIINGIGMTSASTVKVYGRKKFLA